MNPFEFIKYHILINAFKNPFGLSQHVLFKESLKQGSFLWFSSDYRSKNNYYQIPLWAVIIHKKVMYISFFICNN